MPGRTVVSADRVGNTMMDADITHIREPIKCDACHAFIMRSITSRTRIRANVRRRRRRCYLPIASLDGELTILYGNPQLGYRLLKALTDVVGCILVALNRKQQPAVSLPIRSTFKLNW